MEHASDHCEHAFFRCLTTRLLHAICDFYLARDATRKDLIPFHRPGSHGIKVVREAEHRAICELPQCAGISFSAKTYQHIVDKIMQDSDRVEALLANPNLKGNIDHFSGLRNELNERVDWDGRVLTQEELKREELLPVAARIAFPVSTMQLERECAEHGILDPAKKEEYLKQHKLRYVESLIKIYAMFHRPPRANLELSISLEEDTTWLQKDVKRRKRSAKQLDVTSTFMMSADSSGSGSGNNNGSSSGGSGSGTGILHAHKKQAMDFEELDLLRGSHTHAHSQSHTQPHTQPHAHAQAGSANVNAVVAAAAAASAAAMAPVHENNTDHMHHRLAQHTHAHAQQHTHGHPQHLNAGMMAKKTASQAQPHTQTQTQQPSLVFASRPLGVAHTQQQQHTQHSHSTDDEAINAAAALEDSEELRQKIQFDLQREKEREAFELVVREENCVDAHAALRLRDWIAHYGFTSPVIVRGMDEQDWAEVLVCLKAGPKKALLSLRQEISNAAAQAATAGSSGNVNSGNQ